MKLINIDDINNLTFSDYSVNSITWGRESCTIDTNGATWMQEDERQFDSCCIYISSWAALNIKSYNHILDEWSVCEKQEEIKDVCEFLLDGDLIIRGFGKTSGEWLEYKFISPIEIYVELF